MRKGLFLLALIFALNLKAQNLDFLISPIESTIVVFDNPENSVVRKAALFKLPSHFHDFNGQIIINSMNEVNIKLFDGIELTVQKKKVLFNNNGYMWYGSTSGQNINVYISVRNNGTLFGRLELGRYQYKIFIDDNGSEVLEIDTNSIVMVENSKKSEVGAFSNINSFSPHEQYEINFLIALSPKAQTFWHLGGSRYKTESELTNYLDELNLKVNGAFLNTGIENVRVNFSHVEFLKCPPSDPDCNSCEKEYYCWKYQDIGGIDGSEKSNKNENGYSFYLRELARNLNTKINSIALLTKYTDCSANPGSSGETDGINLISDFESAHINVFSHELGHILGLNHPIELIAGDYAEGREECLDCIIKRNYDENGEIYFKADDAPGYCDDDSCWRPCGTPDICALKATQKYNELLNNALIGTNHGYVNSAISTIMDKVSEKWINSFSRSDEDWILDYIGNQYPVTTERGNSVYADAYRYFIEGSSISDVSERGNIAECNENRADWCTDNDEDGVCDYRASVIKDFCGNPNYKLRQSQGSVHSNNSGNRYIIDNGTSDNCPGVYNPLKKETNPYRELFSARKDDEGFSGAALKGLGYYSSDRKYFIWQPDHDLDGFGDACDLFFSSLTSKYSGGVAYVSVNDVKGLSKKKSWFENLVTKDIVNYNAKIGVTMPKHSGDNPDICPAGFCKTAIHYCAVGHEQKDRWGEDSFCTTTEKTLNPVYNTQNEFTCDFGFSHGTDNYTEESAIRWERRITNTNVNIDYEDGDHNVAFSRKLVDKKGAWTTYIDWNWRRDWYVQNRCLDDPDRNICSSLRTATEKNEEFTMYYTISAGVVNPNENYKITVGGRDDINSSYFITDSKYSRSSRYGMGRDSTVVMELNYYMRELDIGITPDLDDIEIEYCPSCYWNIPIRQIYGQDGVPIPEAAERVGRWSIEKVGTEYSFNSQKLYLNSGSIMTIEANNRELFSVNPDQSSQQHELFFNSAASGADWNRIGIISNWDININSVKTAAEKNGMIYFISKKGQANNFYYLFRLNIINSLPLGTYVCDEPVNTYMLEEMGLLGINEENFDSWRMISANDKIYIVGSQFSSDSTKMFKLNEEDEFEAITGTTPSASSILNTGSFGKYIFLTGGMNANNGSMTDIWRFDTESEEWTQVPVSLVGDFRKVITQFVDGKLVMANPVMTGNLTHPAFTINNPEAVSVSEIIISYIDIPVTEVEYIEADTYCLNETGTLIKGGLEMSGVCVPFTHPWYRSFATGSTIYSVAGKGDRLYVGTNNSIKVYDISDPNALVLKSTFSTNKRVYDLEVAEGDIMYAATSGGLYKLDTANPDTLSSISFFATSYNYQYRIQLYNDKLYVGDDNGINIRHKDTFTRLAYVNVGSVPDFAITNGEIALYRSSFWSAGLHIRDVETLNLKAYEYAECYTGELTTDHGAFYFSCDGYEYRFEGRPDTYFNFYPLDGDMREMQENHVYSGWTYIPDGSSVKLSTLNDVPSYCGNGVIEPGELCDGNSVQCTTLDPDYTGGTAACNSTCDGYNENYCEEDGW